MPKTPEERKAYFKAYYQAHKEQRKIEDKARYEANKPIILAKMREYYKNNAEKIKAYNRTPARRAMGAKYDAEHREERRQKARAHRAANPGLAYQVVRRYQEKNPDYKLQFEALRRLRLRQNGGSHSKEEWLEKLSQFGGCCAYCGSADKVQRDHDVPVSRGGHSGIANILPACKLCNSRKMKMTAAEFRERLARGGAWD